jgi:hypothetical protein
MNKRKRATKITDWVQIIGALCLVFLAFCVIGIMATPTETHASSLVGSPVSSTAAAVSPVGSSPTTSAPTPDLTATAAAAAATAQAQQATATARHATATVVAGLNATATAIASGPAATATAIAATAVAQATATAAAVTPTPTIVVTPIAPGTPTVAVTPTPRPTTPPPVVTQPVSIQPTLVPNGAGGGNMQLTPVLTTTPMPTDTSTPDASGGSDTATPVPTTAPVVPTPSHQKDDNMGMLVPIAGVSVLVLLVAGIVVGVEWRRRRNGSGGTPAPWMRGTSMTSATSIQAPLVNQSQWEMQFGNSNPQPAVNAYAQQNNGGAYPQQYAPDMATQAYQQQSQQYARNMAAQAYPQQYAAQDMAAQGYPQQYAQDMQDQGYPQQYTQDMAQGYPQQYATQDMSAQGYPQTYDQVYAQGDGQNLGPLPMDMGASEDAADSFLRGGVPQGQGDVTSYYQEPQAQGQDDPFDDPFLEAMMRQAQVGIFASPNKDAGEQVAAGI